jgi:hypothetical protein
MALITHSLDESLKVRRYLIPDTIVSLYHRHSFRKMKLRHAQAMRQPVPLLMNPQIILKISLDRRSEKSYVIFMARERASATFVSLTAPRRDLVEASGVIASESGE